MKTKILATVARKEHLLCGWEKFSEVFLVSLWLSYANTIPWQYGFLLFRVSLRRVLNGHYDVDRKVWRCLPMKWLDTLRGSGPYGKPYMSGLTSDWFPFIYLILTRILNKHLLFQLGSFLLVCSICCSHFFTSTYRLSLMAMKILL